MVPRLNIVLALLSLGIFAGLVLTGTTRIGMTFDEPAHIAAGRAYWVAGDYRFHAENGLLPQLWAALPATIRNESFNRTPNVAWNQGDVWGVARAYLYGPDANTARLLGEARAMILVWALVLLVLIWRWSASLWGESGGLLSLVTAALCPHLLAHGGLVTSDLMASLGFTAASLSWWRLFHTISPGRILAAALATIFLALSKFSAVLLAPIVLLMIAVRLWRRAPIIFRFRKESRRIGGTIRVFALCAAVTPALLLTWLGIWTGYGWRYSAVPERGPAVFAQPWSEVLIEQPRTAGSIMADGSRQDAVELRPGIVQAFVRSARKHHLLPEAYLYGLAFTDRFSRIRLAYFAGEFRERGWREFFPAAFALKTTLPAIVLLGLAIVALRRRVHPRLVYRLSPLLILGGVYGVMAMTRGLNIGHRHLLPLYPLLYVVIGATAVLARSRAGFLCISALILWHGAETLRVRPHFLTYFNQLAGGPAGGHRYFVDSSLDWGQGLPDLKKWLDAHSANERVYLSYFGSDDPRRWGMGAYRFGDTYFNHASVRTALPPLQAGVYCISATMLHRVYTQVRGPWTESYETEYQRLLRWHLQAVATEPGSRRDVDGRPLDEAGWINELLRYDQLRFGRLCAFLSGRSPDASVANCILIFRLNQEDLSAALLAPIPTGSSRTPQEHGI